MHCECSWKEKIGRMLYTVELKNMKESFIILYNQIIILYNQIVGKLQKY